MDLKEEVKIWVENKFGKVINNDLKDKIVEENSQFDIEDYVNSLFDRYLYSNDNENLKKSSTADIYYDLLDIDSENSTEEQNNLNDSLEFESSECQKFFIEKLIKNLESGSEEVLKKSLQALETSTEDIINQSSWNKIEEGLRNIFKKLRNGEIQILVLKVFWKVLKWHKRPQISSKGFISVAEVTAHQINLFNLEDGNISFEEIYDIKEKKWFSKKKSGFEQWKYSAQRGQRSANPEVIIKLMWLLIDFQRHIRINETKYREVIFSFIHLLSSTTTKKNTKLSGLELLSVLSPRASWCHSWCHTAVGRSLLCSALRKYRSFFSQIIEIVLNHVKIKKTSVANDIGLNSKLLKIEDGLFQSLKLNEHTDNQIKKGKNLHKIKNSDENSSPTKNTQNNYTSFKRMNNLRSTTKWIIGWIPNRIVKEALFFHCISFISCLIKSRSGRALFPLKIVKSKRLLTVQDFSVSIIEYLENINYYKWDNSDVGITSAYQDNALEMLNVLKTVSAHMNSFRTSAKRPQISYF